MAAAVEFVCEWPFERLSHVCCRYLEHPELSIVFEEKPGCDWDLIAGQHDQALNRLRRRQEQR